jgi:C4-type Zn-finger protein
MTTCPNCQNEISKPDKTWNFSKFLVEAYLCNNCKTKFRDYSKQGTRVFTLQFKKGRYRKARERSVLEP